MSEIITEDAVMEFNSRHHGDLTRKDIIPRLLTAPDMGGEILRIHRTGLPPGCSTGWTTIDLHYTVAPGQWTLVTGIPGHGKSEWLDALLVNLAEADDWHFAIYSPENFPQAQHAAKLMEKHARKPFGRGPTTRMSETEVIEATAWMGLRFGFIEQSQEQPNDIDEILSNCWKWLHFYGEHRKFRGIVLDPWNELEHQRPRDMSETEYISLTLSKLRRFARTMNCHIWLVAHPKILQRDKDGKRPVPAPYDVSGSAHWFNKADNCITVWRDTGVDDTPIVQIHVQKIRFKNIGKLGLVELRYDRVTGRYFDVSQPSPRTEWYREREPGED